MGLFLFLLIYFFGGVSSLLFAAVVAYLLFYSVTSPLPEKATEKEDLTEDNGDVEDTKLPAPDEKTLRKLKNEPVHDVAAGYFAVTREFVPGGINGKPPERPSQAGIYARTEDSSPSMYQTMVRSIFDRRQVSSPGSKGTRRANNVFYVVLRHGHLMLYDDADQLEVRHVISLSHHKVGIYAGGEEIPEGELYIRRNAICLTRKDIVGAPESFAKNASWTRPFFLFSENCSEKEDFYFALLRNQEKWREDDSEPPEPLMYESHHLISLIQQLHSSEEHLQTRWINAIVGRVFLSVYKSPEFSNFLKAKIVRKIARVKKPAFLGDINIQKVDVGEAAPFITNPRLKDLNVNGEMAVEFDFSYSGNARIEVATSVKIDLGQRFKTREVDLILSVCIRKLEGHGIIKVKPPPSNRLWFTFETMPEMKVAIEPIVSTRQITFQPILTLIENRIREVLAETIVYPHFDDIPFTDSSNQEIRGGAWRVARAITEIPKLLDANGEDKAVALEENLGLPTDNKKSLSAPNLPQAVSNLTGPKQYGSEKVIEDSVSESNISASSGLRSKSGSDLKPKSMRATSFSSLTPATPLVSTDAVNVTAVRESLNKNRSNGGAKLMVQATMERSRSQSVSKSPQSSPVGSPSTYSTSIISSSSIDGEEDTDEFYPASEEALIEELEVTRNSKSHSTSATTSSSSTPRLASSPPTISSNSSKRFTNTSTSSASSPNFNFSTPLNTNGAQNGKLGAVTAAVRKWYKSRQESGSEEQKAPTSSIPHESMLGLSTSSTFSSSSTASIEPKYVSKPPPAEIPPPLAKKTAPIAVPKRRPLPPPLLPPRNNSEHGNNNVSKRHLPPLSQRDGAGVDDVLIVAAPILPESEPSSPQSELLNDLIAGTDDEPRFKITGIPKTNSPVSGASSPTGSAFSSSHGRNASIDGGKVEEKEKSKDDEKVNWKKTMGMGLSVGVRDGWYNEEE